MDKNLYPLQFTPVATERPWGKENWLLADLGYIDSEVLGGWLDGNTLSELMLASDMILTKAGGLITSESLAAGLPMLLTDVLPGQEEGNAKIVEDNDAGRILRSQYAMLEILYHMLANDGHRMKQLQQNALRIGKPHAARDISKIAEELIKKSELDAGDLTALV